MAAAIFSAPFFAQSACLASTITRTTGSVPDARKTTHGLPSDASVEEQTMRARMLQQRSGWGQWGCAYKLGLV